jgi:glycine cleavage system transcriptional repressor
MARYSLHAIGSDRPGIVAQVTGVLADAGCNLEDSRMSILYGQFAITLIVETPPELLAAAFEHSFDDVQREFDLLIAIRPLVDQVFDDERDEVIMVSVHGADRPGIVSQVSAGVAELDGNIIDLVTHKIEAQGGASYVLLLSVATSPRCTEELLRVRLGEISARLGVTCVVHASSNELL